MVTAVTMPAEGVLKLPPSETWHTQEPCWNSGFAHCVLHTLLHGEKDGGAVRDQSGWVGSTARSR